MGDHFMLIVNRLITDSTIEAALRSETRIMQPPANTSNVLHSTSPHTDSFSSPGKLVECRICHEEGEDSNMEMPCTCRGSLKYAHRKCIQRWCMEKGDTTCEICRQQFRPNYIAPPPPLLHYGGISMNISGAYYRFRASWEIPRRDLHDARFVAMVAANNELSDTDIEDFPAPSTRGLMCCRIVAIIFMVLLVLRHTLPIVLSAGDYSLTLLTSVFSCQYFSWFEHSRLSNAEDASRFHIYRSALWMKKVICHYLKLRHDRFMFGETKSDAAIISDLHRIQYLIL